MKRRYLIPLAAAATLVVPAVVDAHTPSVADSCTGIRINLSNYEGGATNNRVTVTIDGVTRSFDFGADYTATFPWAPTAPHTWTVVIDANRVVGHPTEFDRTFTGSEQPCQQPTTTTSTPTTSTSAPTTTTSIPDTTTTTTAPSTTIPSPESSTSTTPATSVPGSVIPTTTPPTSSAPPATTSPSEPVDPGGRLPDTGFPIPLWAGIALLLIGVGGGTWYLARRRP